MTKRVLAYVLTFSMGLWLVEPAWSANGATLRGFILDKNKKPVPNAVVKAKNLSTGQEFYSMPTSENGSYTLKNLPPGDYKISVIVNDKKYIVEKKLTVKENADIFMSFVLKKSKKKLLALVLLGSAAIAVGVYELTKKEKEASPTK